MHRVGRRPGKQFVQSRRRPAIDELREDVGEPALGADAIELARFNERSQQCPILGTLVAPSEQSILGIELDRPHRALDSVRVYLDAPVLKIERQAVPMTQRIANSLRRVALPRKVIKRCLKPLLQGYSQRPGMRLSARVALGIRSTAEGFLDRVELGDALEGFTGNGRRRRRSLALDLHKLAPQMRPAEGERTRQGVRTRLSGHGLVGLIAIAMDNAAVA